MDRKAIKCVIIAGIALFALVIILVGMSKIREVDAPYEKIKKTGEALSSRAVILSEDEEALHPEIDFEYLKSLNSDVCGYLISSDGSISYPVVQGKDNSYYLNHSFERQEAACGAIMADCWTEDILNSERVVVYGHNMRAAAMFGRLCMFEYEDVFCSNLYWDVWLKDEWFEYEAVSFSKISSGSYVYDCSSETKESLAAAKSDVLAGAIKTVENAEEKLMKAKHVLYLSTCYGTGIEGKRLVLALVRSDRASGSSDISTDSYNSEEK